VAHGEGSPRLGTADSAVVVLDLLRFRANEICEWFGLTGKQDIFRSRERDVVVATVLTNFLNFGPFSGVPVFLALLCAPVLRVPTAQGAL